jgi:two-component system, LytTR family, sensor kinase
MKLFLTILSIMLFLSALQAQQKEIVDTALVRKIVKENFVNENDAVVRYLNTNILVQLEGYPNHFDSLFFLQEIEKLKPCITGFYIDLVNSKAPNLVFAINQGPGGDTKHFFSVKDSYSLITKLRAHLFLFPKDTVQKRQIIKYFLCRALVNFDESDTLKTRIPGSVFSETDISKTKTLSIDYEIIKEIYSGKYDNKNANSAAQKALSGKKTSPLFTNYDLIKKMKLPLEIAAVVLPLLVLLLFYFLGFFRPHNYKFFSFFGQGILILTAVLLYFFIIFFAEFIRQSSLAINSSVKNTPENLLWALLIILLIGLFSIVTIWVTEKKLKPKSVNPMVKIIIPIIVTVTVPTLLWTTFYVAFAKVSFYNGATNAFNYLPKCGAVVFAIAIIRHFSILVNQYSEKWIQQKETELVRLAELHRQAELQALRAKINPHFLYNSLNSIASLARTDAGKTEKMALALSDFFKYAINREQSKMNYLEEELNAVRTYLEIEKVRFGNRLNYEIHWPETLRNALVPQLIIQPLVENAIKHGISKSSAAGFVKIKVRETNHQLIVQVFDSGPPFPDGPISGYGLKNTGERLNLIYGEKANLNWENQPDKFIELQIPLTA